MGLAALIILFISVLVGLSLFPTIAQYVGAVTDSLTFNSTLGNGQYTTPADGDTIDLTGQDLLNTPVVMNDSGEPIAAGNYTIDEGISTTSGQKSIQYTAIGSEQDGVTINISYEYGPDGYITNAGARSITTLIVLFFALGIAIVAMTPAFRNKLFDLIGK